MSTKKSILARKNAKIEHNIFYDVSHNENGLEKTLKH